MKHIYAVRHGGTLTVFSDRLDLAIAYWQACVGSVLLYKAHGRWGGNAKRTTRWLRMPMPSNVMPAGQVGGLNQ